MNVAGKHNFKSNITRGAFIVIVIVISNSTILEPDEFGAPVRSLR